LKREEKKLKEYLKAKYNDEFVINKLDYYIPQIGSLMIKGTASPKDNRDIIFQIVSSSLDTDSSDKFGDDYRNNGHYDNYLNFLYGEKGEKDYKPYFDKYLGKNSVLFELEIYLSNHFTGNRYIGYVPKYEEMKEGYTSEMGLIVTTKFSEEHFDIEKRVAEIVELVKKLKEPKLDYYRVNIQYLEGKTQYSFRIFGEEIEKYLDSKYLIDNVLIKKIEE
ncbi:MAG: hypothetical protein N4A76_16260, partial [Firmicutes bacterium]|nr:hypothetical protein [Bacillota bacterium]